MYGPIRCGYFTAKRKLTARFFHRKTKRLIEERIENAEKVPFFFFPMQLESDAQLRKYSIYPDMTTALAEVIDSFAEHAPAHTRLLIKVHPLDVGIVDWNREIRRLASKRGVDGRVDYIDVGLLDDIIKAAAGIVTINSTVGVIGLRFQKNVKTLGQAIYDIPGITFQGSLDAFWNATDFLDHELCEDYIRVLGGCLHVRGSYYTSPGVHYAARSAAARLHFDMVNCPADPGSPAPALKRDPATVG
jgi:capsular polysaccharide export protein